MTPIKNYGLFTRRFRRTLDGGKVCFAGLRCLSRKYSWSRLRRSASSRECFAHGVHPSFTAGAVRAQAGMQVRCPASSQKFPCRRRIVAGSIPGRTFFRRLNGHTSVIRIAIESIKEKNTDFSLAAASNTFRSLCDTLWPCAYPARSGQKYL
jgi:hypothetical protein